MKKTISIVMTLVMALTIFVIPTGAAYAEGEEDAVIPDGEAVLQAEGEVEETEGEDADVLNALEGEPQTPANLKADENSITENSIKFVWDAVTEADGYAVSFNGGAWEDKTDTFYEATGLDANTEYTIKVKAFKGTGDVRTWSDEANASERTKEVTPPEPEYIVPAAPAAPKITGATPGYTNIKYTWGKVEGADGYAYRRFATTEATLKEHKKFRDNGTNLSFNYTGLKQRTTATLYVCAYKKLNPQPANSEEIEIAEEKGAVMINPKGEWVVLSKYASKSATTNSSEKMTRKKKSRGYIYKYYNDAYGKGDLGTSYAMWNKVQKTKSKTKYLIAIDTKRNNVVIYKGKKGHWKVYKHVICSCGMPSHTTPHGTFKIFKRKPKFAGFIQRHGHVTKDKYTCWYATRFKGACFFHSTLYKYNSKSAHADRKLGDNRSHGCIRMNISDARWIYKNCKNGTAVVSSSYPKDCSFGKWKW